MLEIILVILLCRWCSRTAREKGHSGGLYGFFTVALWFGFEIAGFITGLFLTGEPSIGTYLMGLLGAGLGALTAYLIVNGLADRGTYYEAPARPPIAPISQPSAPPAYSRPPVLQAPAPQAARYCTKCGSPLVPGGRFCGRCGAPVV